jgi:hypothetical protein
MANFNQTIKPTSFGFFDADPIYQKDADKVVNFVLTFHGEQILSAELTKKMIWSCFERAAFTFNAQMVEYQAKSNLANLLGTPTGSVNSTNPNTADLSINLSNQYVQPNLEFLIKQAEPYSAEIGLGQSENTYSGSIHLLDGKQDYDLYTDLVDHKGIPIINMSPSGTNGRMRVIEVFHDAPTPYSFAGYGLYGTGLFNTDTSGSGGTQPGAFALNTRFNVMPIFEDVLRGGMMKEALRLRRSNYRYRISGRHIRIYPIPRTDLSALWIRVRFPGTPSSGIYGTTISGSTGTGDSLLQDNSLFGVNSPANIPFGLMNYASLNPWAKNWIFEYTLALATVLLGRIRGKFKSIPIGGADLQLNGDDLVAQGREDIDKLLYSENGLVAKLESLTYDKLAEKESAKAESLMKQLTMLPFNPRVNISIR